MRENIKFVELDEDNIYFHIFKREAHKWINRFGLNDWRIEFFIGDSCGSYPPGAIKVNPEARAFVTWKIEARAAGIYLERRWPEEELTELAVRRSAFHEVNHILIGRLNMMATMRYLDCEDTISEEVHVIIRRLENAMFMNEYLSEGVDEAEAKRKRLKKMAKAKK